MCITSVLANFPPNTGPIRPVRVLRHHPLGASPVAAIEMWPSHQIQYLFGSLDLPLSYTAYRYAYVILSAYDSS